MNKRRLLSVHKKVIEILLLGFYTSLRSLEAVCPLCFYSNTNADTQEGKSKSRSIMPLETAIGTKQDINSKCRSLILPTDQCLGAEAEFCAACRGSGSEVGVLEQKRQTDAVQVSQGQAWGLQARALDCMTPVKVS